MSRGFVREEDQEETPLVTPRASLPFGIDNYVTANGLKELKLEKTTLSEEQKALSEKSKEANRVQINYITAKLSLLNERINSARLVILTSQPQNEVHFGATVTLFKNDENCDCQYQIVGVDEANISKNKVSFLSPIAKILLRKKVNELITLKTPQGERVMTVKVIEYKQD